jgi:hypothetical protein
VESRKIVENKWSYVPIAVLIFLLASEIVWYAPYTSPKTGSLQVLEVTSQGNNLTIGFKLSSAFVTNATVVAIPVIRDPQDQPVYVFYDTNYTTDGVGSDWSLIYRLYEHLKINLMLRNYSANVKLVDAMALESVFRSNEPAVVIMAYGAFPSNVFSLERNLVTPWIQSGGTIIWLGWEMGYYTVDKEQKTLTSEMLGQPHLDGISRLGMEDFLQPTSGPPYLVFAQQESTISDALDIRYNQIRCAPLLDKVIASGGIALGKVGPLNSSTRVSVSAIPIGDGAVVSFGFFIGNIDTAGDRNDPSSFYSIARDIAQILCSGVLQTSSTLELWHQNYHLSNGETIIEKCSVSIKPSIKGIFFYGYNSIDSSGLLFFREYLPL